MLMRHCWLTCALALLVAGFASSATLSEAKPRHGGHSHVRPRDHGRQPASAHRHTPVRSTGPQIVRVGAIHTAHNDAVARGARSYGFHVVPPRRAEAFTLITVDRRRLSLRNYAGHWLLLHFFSTWCPACEKQLPSLRSFHQFIAPHNVQVVAIATDDQIGSVTDYAHTQDLRFDVLHDVRHTVAKHYKISRLPTTFLIDPQGVIIGVARGKVDWQNLKSFAYQALR